ncbi:unnamed protein product [Musa acuminata subsp. malaccensis]|uniref:(wild Malaysian banana) hypothetical protein n=1 Tax=Musa acuminata subsp. malaccensis TaxID=214687 RepID=A0A804J1Q7_MUSAM|nr:PREDICTED: probable transcriptional regulator RABBIT EARS [Musa acuminata subsp. malaccensis]CAG1837736.1 unnamed protein product [Musa acuminata subsp. malaccensis]
MEQARCWMWTRTRHSGRPHLSAQIPGVVLGSSSNESWEERAFAEDAAGRLGGCTWPPRSYSCSFCRREFRSAQALGGHMNVHRRDRARLKQLSSSLGEETAEAEDEQVTGAELRPQVSPNPSSRFLPPPLSPRVSAPSIQENWPDNTLISPPFSSSIAREDPNESLFSTTRSLHHPTLLHLLIVPESKLGETNLGSNGFGFRSRRDPGIYDEQTSCYKRSRTERPSSCEQQQVQSEVPDHNHLEELDLELRLGSIPKM